MGTSSIFNGRTDKNALLPNDFNNDENSPIDQSEVNLIFQSTLIVVETKGL